ncbi:MAG: argininosuccinate lyase [Cenarchaeum sp. SB0661_bin_35]|nr:argininosuccinate lyase [Cenarchaeum sp. SB0667_bin_13]MXZ93718.1 argininosuccinate lyase [Cenarchaeum sp. SB0666_bin_15]MYC79907.1 argininosuccinate lyase [Cenarchaeum sp. SB0661_bin_35]MYD59091.1 argininosuccinate lyase [Cenarchaeum sp. SB0678_bin_8]MYI51617.1 argininosuccinate lyase [Cenarchaeum sp. SB0673_bin_9]MYJ28047.1 argininosuccinate lyase [Cenarchaeum sp. SB0672_bin_9]
MRNDLTGTRPSFLREEPVESPRHEYIGWGVIHGMYRGGLGSELDDVAKDFVKARDLDLGIFTYDVMGTKAHVMMLYNSNIISRKDAAGMLTVLEEVEERILEGSITQDGEDCHEFIEKYITQRLGDEVGGKIQTGRSRNDQVATAIKLRLRHDTTIIQMRILYLIKRLIDIADENKETIVPLYTHLQHAQVGVLSHYFMAFVDALTRDFERFQDMYKRLNTNPLGSGPAGGTNIPINRSMTTKTLAFSRMHMNSLDATSNRDYMSEFVSCAAIMMVNLSRMAEDLVLWSSSEFSFIEITDRLASPSSIMPQKKNPDILELVRGKAATALGCLTSVLAVQKGLATGYSRDLQETKDAVWITADDAQGALQVMSSTLYGLKIDKRRMVETTKAGHILALDIAEKLVEEGVPFRKAHMEVGALVAVVRSQDRELIDLTDEEIGSATTLDTKTIRNILNQCTAQKSAYERRSMGSTSAREQYRFIEKGRKDLEHMLSQMEKQKSQHATALNEMREKIKEIVPMDKR